MKTLKKCIAFMLAVGLIVTAVKVTAVTVLADSDRITIDGVEMDLADLYPSGDVKRNENGGYDFTGPNAPNWIDASNRWHNTNDDRWYHTIKTVDGRTAWVPIREVSSSSKSQSGDVWYYLEEEISASEARAEAEAVQQAASDEGFADVGDMYMAAEKSMSAGEYYNNVVTSTPGIENAVTVGQGGNLVVNGEVTNMTASITKVTNRAYVDSVRISQPEGILLNVVDVQYPAVEATINFYMPSVTAEMDIVAMQYNAGTWVNVDVAEVREDHVVLDMKGNGVIAFIAR